MRILVVLIHLELGGCQLNALDFALASRERGHDVFIFGPVWDDQPPGPVAEMVRSAGLPLTLFHHPDTIPGVIPAHRLLAKRLSQIVAEENVQLIHAYETPMILDSFHGPHLKFGVPLVCTAYGLVVQWWLPRYPPLIVATQELADLAAPLRTQRPVVIQPPINTDLDDPALIDGAAFRRAHGLGDDIVVGVVSRLEPMYKADGIKLAIDAIRYLDDPRIRLVLTGDGPSFGALSALAEQANTALGRRAVVMTGELTDPRPAYAAADIALGMGGSAQRSMAFGKPLVVLGRQDFAKPLLSSTAEEFLYAGFCGKGSDDFDPRPLASHIRLLADQPEMRSQLGAFGRQLVLDRLSLKAASAKLEDVYMTAVGQTHPRHQRVQEAMRVMAYRQISGGIPQSLKARLGKRTVSGNS
jgi:glycosyltransferase involved in cell wall biosynthesis